MHNRSGVRSGFTGELLDVSGIQSLDEAEWDHLSARAVYENPFYSRQYIMAGLKTIDRQRNLRAIAVRDAMGRLEGLFPFRRITVPPFPWAVARGAENSQQFSGTPLIAAHDVRGVVEAWLDTIGRNGVPGFWALGNVDLDSVVRKTIEEAVAARGLGHAVVLPYERPHLTRLPGGLAAHRAEVIARKRLKDIERNLRRLREMGETTFERATEPSVVRERLEQFLVLEHSGWKGRKGTAFLSSADEAAFARLAFGGEAAEASLASIDSLLLDGRPIAISINIASGTTAFTAKCAYDESLRRYGPGLVLEYLVIESFHESGEFSDMDAATTVDGHIVTGLWNRQKPMGRLLVGLDSWRTRLLAGVWTAGYHARKGLRALREKVKTALLSLPGFSAVSTLPLDHFC